MGTTTTRNALSLCLLLIPCFCGSTDTIFYDSIDDTFAERWSVSHQHDYQGLQDLEIEGQDNTKLVPRKYAIVKELDEPVTLENRTLVLEFQTLLQNGPGSECGAVYLKYLRPQVSGWKPEDFDSKSPYSIMFGAHICGAMINVHFIVTQTSPHSKKYTEHRLKLPPSVQSDQQTQLFTAVMKPDNELRIIVNGKEERKANLLSADDFEPPLVPVDQARDLDQELSFDPIVAIGIELWTMRYGILVDNVMMASNEEVAESYSWKVEAEKGRLKDLVQKLKNQPKPRTDDCIIVLIFIALVITILFPWKKNTKLGVLDNPNLHLVSFSGGLIETLVTNKAEEVDSWIGSIRTSYNGKPVVVGFDCEWKPNSVKNSVPNKAAILQLCVDNKCLIMQLFHMDLVPQSLHNFLNDPYFIFVGVEVERDITKLRDEYGIGCRRFDDLRNLALNSEAYSDCYRFGLRNLASFVVGLEISKPADSCRSNWEARELDEEQIQYASIDAYASYTIGHKLIYKM